MAIFQDVPQIIEASDNLDDLQAPAANRQNPLWKAIRSTAKRAHESWETTLEEGMKKHQTAIDGVVKGAQDFVSQSVHKATETYDSVAKGVATETAAGISIIRNSLGLKAASDALERELKFNESVLGGSPAITTEQRAALNQLARAEQKSIQADGDKRLDVTLTKNESLATDRHTINTELKAIGEEGIDAIAKLRMDLKAARSQIEQLNRTGQPVDVPKVFEAVRKVESNPERNRSKIVSLLVGQSAKERDGAIATNITSVQPETKGVTPEPKPALQIVEPKTDPKPDYSEIKTTLNEFSKTRLRRIATALNGKVGEEDKITKVRSRDKNDLLEILGTPERLSVLAQNRNLFENNMAVTAATRIKGDKVTASRARR